MTIFGVASCRQQEAMCARTPQSRVAQWVVVPAAAAVEHPGKCVGREGQRVQLFVRSRSELSVLSCGNNTLQRPPSCMTVYSTCTMRREGGCARREQQAGESIMQSGFQCVGGGGGVT